MHISSLKPNVSRVWRQSLTLLFVGVVFLGGWSAANAATLTTGQIDSIVGLLRAFGADQSVINNVQITLSGGTLATQTAPAASSCASLSYNLYVGVTDAAANGEVSRLQDFLGIAPQTGYFGPLTELAVKHWQASHGIVSSGSPETTGYGVAGSQTRAAMACSAQTPTATDTTTTPPSTVADSIAPSAPSNLRFEAPSSTVVQLNWDAATDAQGVTGYVVYRNGAQIGTTVTNSFADTAAQTQTTYSYYVTAHDAADNVSASSNTIQAVTPAVTSGASTVSLTASAHSVTSGQSVTLTWVSTNATDCIANGFAATGTSGSVTVMPQTDTTYSISCAGAAGSVTGSTQVAVVPPVTTPPVTSVADTTTSVDPYSIISVYNASLDAVAAPASVFGTGKVWHVGKTQANKTFGEIARSLSDGDVVEIDAGTYKCDQSIVWYANNITVVGVGGRAVFDATGCNISGDKGIFNPRGNNMIIANIEFLGAQGSSGNDAGIRLDSGGYVYITNSYFHDNQDGVLMTPDTSLRASTNVVIDHSEFAHNGTGTGLTHNMYLSALNSFVLRFSYSHDAVVGHEVKSRAENNYVLYNRIADETSGDASYQIDIPQGGLTYIIGNLIQKGPNAQNGTNITFAVEYPQAPANQVQKLYVANNTIINEDSTVAYRYVLNIADAGLTEAKLVNNLIVGAPATQIVQGTGKAEVTQSGNVVTDSPGFYDEANRIYYLTADSPAVDAAVAAGTGAGFALAPLYQFVLPHSGEVRPTVGALDVGAYEYTTGRSITPAPKVTFTAAANPVAFSTGATLSWSSTNASSCTGSGGWSGTRATSGSFVTPALTANQSYGISCTGPSGTADATVSVVVNDSAQAVALGTYIWKDIPGSSLTTVCPDITKFPGVTGFCNYRGNMATGVYVPDTERWYLMGGSESYGYSGNEVYAFNLQTLKPERITDPTVLANTKEYNASITPPYNLAACSRALHSSDGSVSMADNGIVGQAAWNPILKKIVLGPWGYQRQTPCTNISSYLTDQWTFDPFSKVWAQIATPDDSFQSTVLSSWFLDPATGIAYNGTGGRNAAPIGSYLLNYGTTPPMKALVDNTWPFSQQGSMAVDTTHHYAFQLVQQEVNAPMQVALYSLTGLSMTAYGTGGQAGTTGLAGGKGPQYNPDTSWTITGDTTILSQYMPSLSYNPKLDLFVAWAGDTKVYFIRLNYATKTANIISKQIPGGPTIADSYGGLSGYLMYIPDQDEYLVFTGMSNDFYLLVPPGGGTSAVATQTNGSATASVFNAIQSFFGKKAPPIAVSTPSSNVTPTVSAPPAVMRVLTPGASGSDVLWAQTVLIAKGHLASGNATGYFGPLTEAAVQAFQCAEGIVCSGTPAMTGYGQVGTKTRAALLAK